MKFNYLKVLFVVVVAFLVFPAGLIHAQSVGDALNPFSAGPSACGVSSEGLCQSSCGPYDDIISSSSSSGEGSSCSKNEQCCVPSKCASSNIGLGECKNVTSCGDGTIGKNTSDCTPPKLCCITPKIIEITCPGGVCTEDNTLNNSLSSVCVEGFESDFCEEYRSNCDQDPNSLMCQQTLIDLTNNEVISTCAENPQLSNCLTACVRGSSSDECQTFLSQSNEPKGLVPCEGFNCSLCSVFELIKNIIDWLVGFIVAISVGFIVWAGISMMFSGGDSGALSKAKEMATTAVIGVAIALSGWLIIGTVLGVLTGSDKVMPWNKITCTSNPIGIGGEAIKQSTACTNAGGVCQNTTTGLCAGTYKSGLCSGSSNIKCCISTAVSLQNCSTILNGAYECKNSECPIDEMVSGICNSGQHCCLKNAPTTILNTTECSGSCRSTCRSGEEQVGEICDSNSTICCKEFNCSGLGGACSKLCSFGAVSGGNCPTGYSCCKLTK
ncbi:MAG: pilin [Minisyncoccota bacterium]